MATMRDRPILTQVFSNVSEFIPKPGSVYVHGSSVEERSAHSEEWESSAVDIQFVRIEDQQASKFAFSLGNERAEILLRSSKQLDSLGKRFENLSVYLDITGLSHHIWAPLLRTFLKLTPSVKVVYVEPRDYRFSLTPTEGDIFDLSEKISGIAPIPGFASLSDVDGDDVCFIPLLGFEGPRFAYLLEQVQPPGQKIFPIIGVPGFQLPYPFHTYQGNQPELIDTKSWKEVRFATANCPFDLFYLLEDIAKLHPDDLIKISPIGTKPHALGAMLFYLTSPRRVEIVYDHPIRKATRTEGTAKLLIYHVSNLALTI